jgi:hypothetical protein
MSAQIFADEMQDILNMEIARELMDEDYSGYSEENFQKVWEICKGKPFDVPVMYGILLAAGLIK